MTLKRNEPSIRVTTGTKEQSVRVSRGRGLGYLLASKYGITHPVVDESSTMNLKNVDNH